MKYRIVGGVVVLAGVLFVGASFVFFPHNGAHGCENHVTLEPDIDASNVSYDGLHTFRYSQLSDDAKRVFDTARNSDDHSITVYDSRCPDEFTYGYPLDHYLIVKNGAVYELTVSGPPGWGVNVASILNRVLQVGGLLSILSGLGILYVTSDVKLKKP
jgi:hypothetical protein